MNINDALNEFLFAIRKQSLTPPSVDSGVTVILKKSDWDIVVRETVKEHSIQPPQFTPNTGTFTIRNTFGDVRFKIQEEQVIERKKELNQVFTIMHDIVNEFEGKEIPPCIKERAREWLNETAKKYYE